MYLVVEMVEHSVVLMVGAKVVYWGFLMAGLWGLHWAE